MWSSIRETDNNIKKRQPRHVDRLYLIIHVPKNRVIRVTLQEKISISIRVRFTQLTFPLERLHIIPV